MSEYSDRVRERRNFERLERSVAFAALLVTVVTIAMAVLVLVELNDMTVGC